MKKFFNRSVFLLFLVLTVTLAVSCSQDVSSLVRVGVGFSDSKSLSVGPGPSTSRYYSAIPLWTTSYSGVYGYTAKSTVSGTALNLLLEQGRWRITVWDVAPNESIVYEGFWEDYVNPTTGTIEITMKHITENNGFLVLNFTSPARAAGSSNATITIVKTTEVGVPGQTVDIAGVLSSDLTTFTFTSSVSLEPGFYHVAFLVTNSIGETSGHPSKTVEVLNGQTIAITGDIDDGLFEMVTARVTVPEWSSGTVSVLPGVVNSGEYIHASLGTGLPSTTYQWYVDGLAVLSGSKTDHFFVAPYVTEETQVEISCLSGSGIWYKGKVTVVPVQAVYEFFSDSGYSTSTTVKVGDNASNIYYKKNGVQMGRVGGVIYFIDENAGAGEDKYYVIVASTYYVSTSMRWSNESAIVNSPYNGNGLGVGKRVTQWMLENAGASSSPAFSGSNTIWIKLRDTNNGSGILGQKDWYVGSPYEYELAKLLGAGPETPSVNIGTIFFNTSGQYQYAWTCYEVSSTHAWVVQKSGGIQMLKSTNASLIPMRSF